MDEDVKGFVEAYHDILLSGGPAYASIFRYLATLPNAAESENQPQGALIHCTAGKDRTGMFFAVLLSYLGVPKQVIAEEYNLTELGLAPVRESVVERLMLSPAFKNYIISRARGTPLSSSEIAKIIADEKEGKTTDSEDLVIPPEAMAKGRDAALRMVSAKKESMLQSLEMLEREFRGAEKYMRDVCGLSEGEMEALKRNLVGGKGVA